MFLTFVISTKRETKNISRDMSTKKSKYFLLLYYYKSKLQVFSFMFTSNCRRCTFSQKFTGGVLNLPKSYMFCHLDQT
ncbi:hypothetical protein Hanom_Chr08g00738301 [Helianthus anomalus]